MFTVSPRAMQELKAFCDRNPKAPRCVRVFFRSSCQGPRAMLGFDSPRPEADASEELDGLAFCMDMGLWQAVGDVAIDLVEQGFAIRTERPFQARSGCASCAAGSSCSTGSASQGSS